MIELDIKKKLRAATGNMELSVKACGKARRIGDLHGESGSGKTSILRMLAGLMVPDSGKIAVGHEIWYESGSKILLPPQKRQVGFVFQDYALFPHYDRPAEPGVCLESQAGCFNRRRADRHHGAISPATTTPCNAFRWSTAAVALARALLDGLQS